MHTCGTCHKTALRSTGITRITCPGARVPVRLLAELLLTSEVVSESPPHQLGSQSKGSSFSNTRQVTPLNIRVNQQGEIYESPLPWPDPCPSPHCQWSILPICARRALSGQTPSFQRSPHRVLKLSGMPCVFLGLEEPPR